ncbi:unnamed protein product [Heterobilharzia americana]|nr:unnamed protein product [Heterobilharzia americana]
MDRIPNKTTCMPRWVTSCHISGQALKSRLLPLARAQIRRRIRRGSLILYPNGNNLESERISTKRSVNDAVALTTLSDTVNKHDRFDQQNSVLPEIIVQNQNLLYLNDSLKSEKTNLKQHQHTTPHFLNELLKAHQSDRRRRSYADIQLREQDKSKVKTHRLTDLLFFEQSEQVTAKKSPHYMDSVDSTQDLCMNRCCLSPINWPCLLNNNNSEMQETGYNLNEVILSLSSQKRNCTDCVMCPKNLVDGNKSPSHRNCSVEDISNSVAIWQKMPGRLLRRRTTQHGPSKQETFKNSKLFTDSSRQAGDTPKLSFVIENVYNQAKRMKSLPPDIYADMNDTATVAFSAVEDKLQQEFDGDNDRCKSNNSCWSSKRHPGYIERMHTICSMSNHKTLMKDNNYSGYFIPRYRRHFAIDKSSISELISLEPKTKSFLPQLRHSRVNSSTSLPMLIKPPPPSPDVKF